MVLDCRIKKLFEKIFIYGRMIKFSHTLFALPFALSAIILAGRQSKLVLWDILWIMLAMTGARSAAMGFNRIVDAGIDGINPRTLAREIPSNRLSKTSAKIFVLLFSIIFIFAAAMLGRLCFFFSFPVLFILFLYSYIKRFTFFSHIYLGFSIGLAPLGAWIAITDNFSWSILLLSLALMTYIAGFDILYACQDINFDKKEGLFSIPARFGVKKSLFIASVLHFFSFCFFLLIRAAFNLGPLYTSVAVLIGLLFIFEHRLIKPDDLSNINIAFFHVNSLISVMLFLGILIDELIRGY